MPRHTSQPQQGQRKNQLQPSEYYRWSIQGRGLVALVEWGSQQQRLSPKTLDLLRKALTSMREDYKRAADQC